VQRQTPAIPSSSRKLAQKAEEKQRLQGASFLDRSAVRLNERRRKEMLTLQQGV
jgi:hypothetical protein